VGSNTKTAHLSYAVGPTLTASGGPPAAAADPQVAAAAAAVDQVTAAAQQPPAADGLPEQYQQLHDGVQQALGQLAAAGDGDLAPQLNDLHGQLATATSGWLNGLSAEQLQQLAGDAGFVHPSLVGLSNTAGHPLAHWLDPAYPPDTASKKTIQAVAEQRYAALCAGQTVSGITLADVHAAEGGPPPPGEVPAGGWLATPAQVLTAQSELTDAVLGCTPYLSSPQQAEQLTKLVAAENHLAGAVCPQLGDALGTAQTAARHQVDQVLNKTHLTAATAAAIAADGVASGQLTAEQVQLLGARQTVSLARRSTPEVDRQQLIDLAAARAGQLEALTHTCGTHPDLVAELAAVDPAAPGGPAALENFMAAAAAKHGAAGHVAAWVTTVPPGGPAQHAVAAAGDSHTVTTAFKAWCGGQPLPALRQAAKKAGLVHPEVAVKSQLATYLAGQWDTDLAAAAEQVQTTTSTKAAAKAALAVAPPPSGAPVASTGHSPTAAPPPLGPAASSPSSSSSSFASQHRALVNALQHSAATASDLPPRHDPSLVKTWTFGPGQAANLGGVHTKTLHTAPDGSTWMFKPDTTGKGARAHAEAAASAALAAAGVPSVPVYAHRLGNSMGSIQPMLSGASCLPAQPASWSQADADAIVRYHVAAWAVGDHDGKPDNVLRTAGGGLVPIDQGAAFKHLGQDKLSLTYHPHGSAAVYQRAYQAHHAGALAPGVSIRPAAAHPVLKAFEAIPDQKWRAMLHATAHEGAKHGVTWVPAMRKRAAATLKVPVDTVTTAQIAETFLDVACERKRSLRAEFAKFFADEVKVPATALLHKRP